MMASQQGQGHVVTLRLNTEEILVLVVVMTVRCALNPTVQVNKNQRFCKISETTYPERHSTKTFAAEN